MSCALFQPARLSQLGSSLTAKKKKKRAAPLNELIVTEDKYLENLVMVRDKFRKPLRIAASENGGLRDPPPPDALDTVGHSLRLIPLHIFLQPNFTDRSNDGKKEEQFFIPNFLRDHNKVD